MKKGILQLIMYCLLLITTATYGQGWDKLFPLDTVPSTYFLDQTVDNGYILGGTAFTPLGQRTYFYKTDINGDTLWSKEYSFATYGWIHDAQQTPDGGYVAVGENYIDIKLVKIDAIGDVTWAKTINLGSDNQAYNVEQTTDGGYVLAGRTKIVNSPFYRNYGLLVKTDANGDTLWTQIYSNGQEDRFRDVKQTTDGGYILLGYTRISTSVRGAYLVKTDANGDTLWTKTIGDNVFASGNSIIETTDGGYAFIGESGGNSSDVFVAKTDGFGNVLWTQIYDSGYKDLGNSIIEHTDGSYVLTGKAGQKGFIKKVNILGNLEWSRDIGYAGFSALGGECIQVGNGYVMVGHQTNYPASPNIADLMLIGVDSLGRRFTNEIKGNVANDLNFNCLKDQGERDFESALIEIVGNNRTWYSVTDSLGNYSIPVDTGAYIVDINAPLYWYACNNSVTVNLPNFYTNSTVDLPLQAQIQCPLMEVDIAAPFLRMAGGGSSYTVHYCNQGTVDAVNATIDVTIDPGLQVLSASIPIISQTGNVLTFNVGTVPYRDCGNFTIQVVVKLTAILGQTYCSEAHIYPDSICLPAWTGPIIDPEVNCLNDSVHFKLKNIGASTFGSQNYYVYEDHFIMNLVSGTTGNIPVNGAFDLSIPADTGKTYRISVAQETGFPAYLGDSIASAAIEGCVPYLNGTFNVGFITQFSNGNSAPHIAVDCQQSIGSYDPNDKSAQPAGYGSQHNIYNYTDLDYKIRFQNTGTDTAFLVVIRDTISPLLDLTTLTMGASSHPYTWRIYGAGILEITFANIMLPDSNVNEPASNGFVRYRIEQKAGNTLGSVIYNAADIYFDLNAPITTNQTWHTIDSNFVPVFLMVDKVLDQKLTVKAYPNPFTYSTTIEVQGKEYEALQLTVFDVMGRMIEVKQVENANKIELLRGDLQTGIYLYELVGDNERINTGKIIVQ